jgi:hypothetical protein
MPPKCRLIALSCALFLMSTAAGSEELRRKAVPWDTCSLVDGKGGDCSASDPPRPFKEFLNPRELAKQPHDLFSAELRWDLNQKGPPVKAVWHEVGILGSHRIRDVRYFEGESVLADVVLAESSSGIFSPLMKYSGEMPAPVIHRIGPAAVLLIQFDGSGNVPSVGTFAWVWGPVGPFRVDVRGAMQEAIHKVAPGHTGYDTGLDWKTLHCVIGTWPEGKYPGKIGVDETVEAWFQLDGTHLAVKRVVFQKGWGKDADERHWP